ncbi:MAG: polysaccharide deacetylase family protein [Bdellovibrionota bacterium]
MNILHLLSQNHLTGAEVYAVTLAHHQLVQGHNVYHLSNGFHYPSKAIKLEFEVETKSKITFIKNILWLRNFINKQNIQVIHTHSRAAAKLAYWAILFTKTAQVSTVHGVQHPSFSKKLHNQYGKFIIAVCENIKNHLIFDFAYNKNQIKIIRNPINSTDYYFLKNERPLNKTLKIAIVGRTTGPKKQRTEQVLNALKNTPAEISIIGGNLSDLNIDVEYKSQIKELNNITLNTSVYSQFDLIIGSGRVCIESMISGVITIAFGEAQYVGLITKSNFFDAIKSNFGDIHPESKDPVINLSQFINDIQTEFNEHHSLSVLAQNEFSLDLIANKILRLYESACFLKNYSSWIPVLMYHKIPDHEINSKHKIFVTKYNFEKHLKFFKNCGFKTLTFSDLQKYRTGQKPFSEFPKKPLILTFDDGYTDNLSNASPLLKKYQFNAQLFLLADSKIKQNNWDLSASEPTHDIVSGLERQRWKDSQFEIGSHGFSHKKITELSSEEALTELTESKKHLENEFGIPINTYAFTYGITNEAAADLAQKAGYDYAVNTDTGGLLIEEDPYRIFRVNIFPDESCLSLFKKTSKWYRKYYYLKRKR